MGAVYVVEHVATGKHRAMKVMQPQLLADPRLVERFVQEARIGSRVQTEHIVDVLDVGVDEPTGTPFLVMELLRGDTLTKRLSRTGVLADRDTRSLQAARERPRAGRTRRASSIATSSPTTSSWWPPRTGPSREGPRLRRSRRCSKRQGQARPPCSARRSTCPRSRSCRRQRHAGIRRVGARPHRVSLPRGKGLLARGGGGGRQCGDDRARGHEPPDGHRVEASSGSRRPRRSCLLRSLVRSRGEPRPSPPLPRRNRCVQRTRGRSHGPHQRGIDGPPPAATRRERVPADVRRRADVDDCTADASHADLRDALTRVASERYAQAGDHGRCPRVPQRRGRAVLLVVAHRQEGVQGAG